jgi:hypothetical protein
VTILNIAVIFTIAIAVTFPFHLQLFSGFVIQFQLQPFAVSMLQEDVVSVQQGRKFSLSHGICVGARSQMKKFPWKSKKNCKRKDKKDGYYYCYYYNYY